MNLAPNIDLTPIVAALRQLELSHAAIKARRAAPMRLRVVRQPSVALEMVTTHMTAEDLDDAAMVDAPFATR